MKLHLGCGKRYFGPDWIHIDCGDYSHLDYHDIVSLPVQDDSCDVIYASHVIEYFDRDEVVGILKEWHRAIKPDGVIRLAVPDFRAIASLYINFGFSLDRFLGPLYGKMTPNGCTTIYHKTVYDFPSIVKLLESIGFCDIRRYEWRSTEHSHIDDHSQAYLPHMDKANGTLISLNIEGSKNTRCHT